MIMRCIGLRDSGIPVSYVKSCQVKSSQARSGQVRSSQGSPTGGWRVVGGVPGGVSSSTASCAASAWGPRAGGGSQRGPRLVAGPIKVRASGGARSSWKFGEGPRSRTTYARPFFTCRGGTGTFIGASTFIWSVRVCATGPRGPIGDGGWGRHRLVLDLSRLELT